MAAGRIEAWESLLRQALEIMDGALAAHTAVASWSLGGGTVLMLRYRHRLSRDIDIFVPDPQMLGYLSPRLNDRTRALAPNYVEDASFLKLYLAEGEIDFVASGRLTAKAVTKEIILGREMFVETSAEIVAKKVWHRAARFTARDMVDLAVVAQRDAGALSLLRPVLAMRRAALLERLASRQAALREDFAALDLLEFRSSFDDCLQTVREVLDSAAGDRAEQRRAAYWFVPAEGNRALTPI